MDTKGYGRCMDTRARASSVLSVVVAAEEATTASTGHSGSQRRAPRRSSGLLGKLAKAGENNRKVEGSITTDLGLLMSSEHVLPDVNDGAKGKRCVCRGA